MWGAEVLIISMNLAIVRDDDDDDDDDDDYDHHHRERSLGKNTAVGSI
jgi:hypothetical protein